MSEDLRPYPLSTWSDAQLWVLSAALVTAPSDPDFAELRGEVTAELQRRGAVERALERMQR